MSNGKTLYYHDPAKIALSNCFLTSNWNYSYNPYITNHWCDFKGWAIYENEMTIFQETNNIPFCLLLLVVFFFDEYLRDKTRKTLVDGIYCTFANFSLEVLSNRLSRFMLCSAPENVSKDEIIDIVIDKPMKRLEIGKYISSLWI